MLLREARSVLFESRLLAEASSTWGKTFEPGWRMYAKKKDDRAIKYIVGVRKGESERGVYSISDGSRYPQKVKLPAGVTVDDVVKDVPKKGYRDVTDAKELAKGTETYFCGEHQSGVVEPFRGTLYHGTKDLKFFSTVGDANHLGGGSHLMSLNGGDAFSLTPDIKIAEQFAEGHGMVVEFKANLKVYYPSRDEDDLDEIDLPDGTDAVAVPLGRYNEKEIALVSWDNNLSEVAVHLPGGRYAVSPRSTYYHGEWNTYVSKWLDDVFGDGFSKLVEDKCKDPDDFDQGEVSCLSWEDDKIKACYGSNPHFTVDGIEGEFKSMSDFTSASSSKMVKESSGAAGPPPENVVFRKNGVTYAVDDPSEPRRSDAFDSDGKKIGSLRTTRRVEFDDGKKYLEIRDVSVHDDHQGKGIGKLLYVALLHAALKDPSVAGLASREKDVKHARVRDIHSYLDFWVSYLQGDDEHEEPYHTFRSSEFRNLKEFKVEQGGG